MTKRFDDGFYQADLPQPPRAPTLDERITEYLSLGGFWNPEQMDHDKVRDLLIDCRTVLASLPAASPPTPTGWRAEVERVRDRYRKYEANGDHTSAWFACNDVIDALNARAAARPAPLPEHADTRRLDRRGPK